MTVASVVRISCVLAVCACWRGGGESEAEEPAPRKKGATCEEVGRNAHDVVERAEDKELAARAVLLQSIVEQRCAADAWSIELRRCVAGAKAVDDARMCDKLATEPQRKAFQHDVEVMIVSEDGQ